MFKTLSTRRPTMLDVNTAMHIFYIFSHQHDLKASRSTDCTWYFVDNLYRIHASCTAISEINANSAQHHCLIRIPILYELFVDPYGQRPSPSPPHYAHAQTILTILASLKPCCLQESLTTHLEWICKSNLKIRIKHSDLMQIHSPKALICHKLYNYVYNVSLNYSTSGQTHYHTDLRRANIVYIEKPLLRTVSWAINNVCSFHFFCRLIRCYVVHTNKGIHLNKTSNSVFFSSCLTLNCMKCIFSKIKDNSSQTVPKSIIKRLKLKSMTGVFKSTSFY
jgi:hypothetical protein